MVQTTYDESMTSTIMNSGVRCPVMSNTDGTVSVSEAETSTVQTVTCPVGQRFLDGRTYIKIKCLIKGVWSQQIPNCVGNYYIYHFSSNFYRGTSI